MYFYVPYSTLCRRMLGLNPRLLRRSNHSARIICAGVPVYFVAFQVNVEEQESSKTILADFIERARYIPLRLTLSERKTLR
jgi:hypothetical protein